MLSVNFLLNDSLMKVLLSLCLSLISWSVWSAPPPMIINDKPAMKKAKESLFLDVKVKRRASADSGRSNKPHGSCVKSDEEGHSRRLDSRVVKRQSDVNGEVCRAKSKTISSDELDHVHFRHL